MRGTAGLEVLREWAEEMASERKAAAVPPDERRLWRQIADEIDAYREGEPVPVSDNQGDLFG